MRKAISTNAEQQAITALLDTHLSPPPSGLRELLEQIHLTQKMVRLVLLRQDTILSGTNYPCHLNQTNYYIIKNSIDLSRLSYTNLYSLMISCNTLSKKRKLKKAAITTCNQTNDTLNLALYMMHLAAIAKNRELNTHLKSATHDNMPHEDYELDRAALLYEYDTNPQSLLELERAYFKKTTAIYYSETSDFRGHDQLLPLDGFELENNAMNDTVGLLLSTYRDLFLLAKQKSNLSNNSNSVEQASRRLFKSVKKKNHDKAHQDPVIETRKLIRDLWNSLSLNHTGFAGLRLKLDLLIRANANNMSDRLIQLFSKILPGEAPDIQYMQHTPLPLPPLFSELTQVKM